MDTIKEQLKSLGLVQTTKSVSVQKVDIKEGEKDISHHVLKHLLGIIVARKRFSKVTTYLLKNELRFTSPIKKKLKELHEGSINNNFLNEVEFSKYVLSLNFKLANKRFKARQEILKERKKPVKNKSSKQKNKVYGKPSKPVPLILGPKIGLGLESKIKISRIRSSDVVIDKNTNQEKVTDKSILYVAGWSLSADE
jgi:hypothetical protein